MGKNAQERNMEEEFSFEDLVEQMKSHIVNVRFVKLDGTDRDMKCTLREDLVPATKSGKQEQFPFSKLITTYDTENEGWRSFYFDRVKDYEYGV